MVLRNYPAHILHFHADYHNGTTLLSLDDLVTGLLGPYEVGAQGVVIWGSFAELNNSTFLTVCLTQLPYVSGVGIYM